jgi:hypothetical protein
MDHANENSVAKTAAVVGAAALGAATIKALAGEKEAAGQES